MVFQALHWQKSIRRAMAMQKVTYRALAQKSAIPHSTLFRYLNRDTTYLPIDEFLLISHLLGIDPLQFIVKDEVQLPLF